MYQMNLSIALAYLCNPRLFINPLQIIKFLTLFTNKIKLISQYEKWKLKKKKIVFVFNH